MLLDALSPSVIDNLSVLPCHWPWPTFKLHSDLGSWIPNHSTPNNINSFLKTIITVQSFYKLFISKYWPSLKVTGWPLWIIMNRECSFPHDHLSVAPYITFNIYWLMHSNHTFFVDSSPLTITPFLISHAAIQFNLYCKSTHEMVRNNIR